MSVVSAMAAYSQQAGIYRHNTDNAHIDKHSGIIPVILAMHWLWLPDDGSCVNRNKLGQILYFSCVFNNTANYIIECIVATIKYWILLMDGATTKIFNIRIYSCEEKSSVKKKYKTNYERTLPDIEVYHINFLTSRNCLPGVLSNTVGCSNRN